jgi:hypothetical protein
MAFVNELIPEDVKGSLPFDVQTGYMGAKPTLWKWTIDRERDAFLVHTGTSGSGGDGPGESYVLSWNGNLVPFTGDPKVLIDAERGKVLSWRIHRLVLPDALYWKRDEVRQLIREALDVMGLLYRRDWVAAVHVEFGRGVPHNSR